MSGIEATAVRDRAGSGPGAGSGAASGGGPVRALADATVGHPTRTFLITGVAMFMAQLDNLVVSIALPSIRESLHAGLSGLQWTVSAYTLTFAVFLLTGSTLGDRFGRRKLFVLGLAVFTGASVASALAPNIGRSEERRVGKEC